MYMNICTLIDMNIYISKANEDWLRIQKGSMSGIINKFLDEARAGKRGLHVLASYETKEEALKSDVVRPDIDLTKIPGVVKGKDFKPKPPVTMTPKSNWGA